MSVFATCEPKTFITKSQGVMILSSLIEHGKFFTSNSSAALLIEIVCGKFATFDFGNTLMSTSSAFGFPVSHEIDTPEEICRQQL